MPEHSRQAPVLASQRRHASPPVSLQRRQRPGCGEMGWPAGLDGVRQRGADNHPRGICMHSVPLGRSICMPWGRTWKCRSSPGSPTQPVAPAPALTVDQVGFGFALGAGTGGSFARETVTPAGLLARLALLGSHVPHKGVLALRGLGEEGSVGSRGLRIMWVSQAGWDAMCHEHCLPTSPLSPAARPTHAPSGRWAPRRGHRTARTSHRSGCSGQCWWRSTSP